MRNSAARILLITDDFPPAVGGIATYLQELYRHVPRGLVLVLAPGGEGSWAADAESGLEVVRYRRSSSPAIQYAAGFYAAVRLILREKPSAIHCGTLISSGLAALFLGWLFRLPYLVHVYGTDLCARGRSRLTQRLALAALRRAARVVVISEFSLGMAVELGVEPPALAKIPPPVDPRRFRPAVEGGHMPPPHAELAGPVLLTVARLIARKGHDTVIRALPIVLRQIPDVTYLIVGEGPERARLESLAAEMGVAGRVLFSGAVADVVPYYQGCDLFVMASRTLEETGEVEGFGIAFCEASACGKPVVAARSGGVAEAVLDGVTGLLVPPDDPQALGRAIVELLGDREKRVRLGAQGREWVLNNLNPEVAGQSLARLLVGAEAPGRRRREHDQATPPAVHKER